ncbi:MAG TPA: molybdopterin-synthase adenylyltransferase MoeB [Sphingomonadales bacterium]|nr:molybdopterin-synthase adenylyltransferase MoeB [Sphingomonadales bacterium]
MTLSDTELARYARHIVLKDIGGEGQQKLLRAKVLVVGAGGLGSVLLLYLAAAGVGQLGIVDNDTVSLSNLQRQVAYGLKDVGKPKTESAKARLAALNPDVKVMTYAQRLDAANAAELVRGYDLVADGSDNFETRFAVNEACFRLKKTLVSAALLQFDGQLSTFKPHLKNAKGEPYPCYRCFVPEKPSRDDAFNCAEMGILGAIAGVMGTLQAVEVIKEITGAGESMAGKLLLYEGLTGHFRTLTLRRDGACPLCGGR